MEPINYGLIFSYGLQMTIVFIAGLLLWATVTMRNADMISDFAATNGLRMSLALVNFWVISAGLVIVPNFAQLLGALGFNADQSTVGIAILIVLAFIKAPEVTVIAPPRPSS